MFPSHDRVEFEEPGIADAVNYFEELGFLTSLNQVAGSFVARVFTKYAPGFALYTNVLRDTFTTTERVGYRSIANFKKAAGIAKSYTRAALGSPMTKEVRDLVERNILPAPSISVGHQLLESEIRDGLNAGISARDVARGRFSSVDEKKLSNRLISLLDKPFVALGAFTESFSKIVTDKTLEKRGFDPAMRRKLSRLAGIPNPGVGGLRVKEANAWFLFYRVAIQGLRAERTFLTNPQTRGGYMLRMGLTTILPKFLMWAASVGMLKELFESMGMEPGDDLEKFYKKTGHYKKENGHVIPMFWMTPDGIKPVWGHSKDEIENNWQAVGLRIPTTEGGRIFGSLTWNILNEATPELRSADTLRTFSRWGMNQVPTGLNPAIETGFQNLQVALGVNPVDSYRNRPIINGTDWDAGGWHRFLV